MTKNILKFWKLCELSAFKKINIKELSKLNAIHANNKYNTTSTEFQNSYLHSKTTTIYKVYIGIADKKRTVKYLYQKFNLGIDDKNIRFADFEKIKTSEKTYLAYVYLNSNGKLISIDDVAININPFFYTLDSLSNSNNVEFDKFTELQNINFNSKYKIETNSRIVIIPNARHLLNIAKYPNCLQYLFKEVNNKTFNSIVIFDKTLVEIQKIADDSGNKNCKNAKIILTNISKDNELDIAIEKSTGNYLNSAIDFANKHPNDFVYLQANKVKKYMQIPANLFLFDSFNNEYIPAINIKYSDIDLNFEVSCEIFTTLKNSLSLPDDIFDTNNILVETLKNQKITNLTYLKNKDFVSHYLQALQERPAKLTLKYLANDIKKIDINDCIEDKKSINALSKFQNIKSRWSASHCLNYSQQAAVNLFFENYNRNENIFSINGPPGTGKTTLLKDVIANIITQKAQHCIDLGDNVFVNGVINNELCGKYEIVITSSNNNAIENIVDEIHKDSEFDFDYLRADNDFLLKGCADEFYKTESWGLISAKLGKSENINDFKASIKSLQENILLCSKLQDKKYLKSRYKRLVKRFNSIKNNISKNEREFLDFTNIDKIKAERKEVAEDIKNEEDYFKKIEVDLSISEISNFEKDIFELESEKNIVNQYIIANNNQLDRFNVFTRKLSYKKYNNILKHKEKLEISLQKIKVNIDKNSRIIDLYTQLNSKKIRQQKLDRIIKKYNSKCYHINDNKFFNLEDDDLQTKSLFASGDYVKNKALLFKCSLEINEVIFLLNKENIFTSIDFYLNDFNKTYVDLHKLKKAFTSLCFLFPAVSTTLAASYNMFKNIKEIGAILCDEAGQAVPQSIVGLLNRANNALIVGDPLQVEPIFDAPNILIDVLFNKLNIENEIYSPLNSSVQTIADNVNEYGSYYKIDEKNTWVGMPLVVHRRCVNPMFAISNKISYNNKMVLATTEIKANDNINNLPPSCWIDVISNNDDFNNGHTSKVEVEKVKEFIQKYKDNIGSYFIISPFKSISSSFPKLCGTVHSFQGMEADVVFFILGGNNNKPGAKSWASNKANILNVAVTRAKKRIYIVGNKVEWERYQYFNQLSNFL